MFTGDGTAYHNVFKFSMCSDKPDTAGANQALCVSNSTDDLLWVSGSAPSSAQTAAATCVSVGSKSMFWLG